MNKMRKKLTKKKFKALVKVIKDDYNMPRIFERERKEFLMLWHTYHAKHQIPYLHDEADRFFNSVTLIFKEDK
jgi:hypothetical protein